MGCGRRLSDATGSKVIYNNNPCEKMTWIIRNMNKH